MDLACQPLPLGERPRLPLDGDQLLAGSLQIRHRLTQGPVLSVHDPVGLRHQPRAGRSDDRSDHRGGMVAAGLIPECQDDGGGEAGNGDHGPGSAQQVKVQEEQWEGHPGEVRTDGQQSGPQSGDHEQPYQGAVSPES